MIWLFPALFGLGCLAAMYRARGDGLRLSLALGLCAVWIVANLMWLGNAIKWIVVPDFLFGVAALLAWVERHSLWATQLVILAYLRLAAHAAFEMSGGVHVIPFIHVLNALFALQLIAVSMPGGIHGFVGLRHILGLGDRHRAGDPAYREQQA